MQADLSDAEAALYRYQIEGEAGFADQFEDRLDEFRLEIDIFESLATNEQERIIFTETAVAFRQHLNQFRSAPCNKL